MTLANFTHNWTAAGRSFSILLSTSPEVLCVSVLKITSVEGYGLLELSAAYDRNSQGFLDSIGDVASSNAPDGASPEFRSLVPTQRRDGISPEDINGGGVFLGPATFERRDPRQSGAVNVASLTAPVFNNATAVPSERVMLGFMTVMFSIHSLLGVTNDTVGPGDNVQVLLLEPESRLNRGSNASGGFAINGSPTIS